MPALRSPLLATAALAAIAAPAHAAPRVVADIAPIHSIAAAVMGSVGAPALIVPPGASEHDHTLRPSEAEALAAADLVIWVGPTLTPWLDGPLDALASGAARLDLAAAPGLRLLDIRAGGPFETHDHAPEGASTIAPEDHEHATADADAKSAVHDDHAEHTEAGGHDPHFWLDPANAAALAAAMASALAEVDPANAAAYAANAETFAADMDDLTAEIAAQLAASQDKPYFVFHDAFQYFEDRFDLPAAGSIALNNAETPRAPRVAEIRARFQNEAIDCVFAEPQFEPKLIATVIEGTPTRTGTLDPVGARLAPGATLYPALLRGLAADLAACLDPQS